MGRANTVLLNVSGGELSPELYARLDLPIYQRGNERIQNYIVLQQGGLQFRNGTKHVKNTLSLKIARLLSFTFSDQDTYVICLTDKKMRVFRNFGAVLNTTTKNITGITKANPGVISSTAHGYVNGDEVYIDGIVGMKQLNGQFFIVANANANDFTLKNVFGDDIDTTTFDAYTSGGTINSVYAINTPYKEEHIFDLHIKQSADTIYITHQWYAPHKLTRTGHTNWSIAHFIRTNDPFAQKVISSATEANPGVFTTSAVHGLAVDDEVVIHGMAGGNSWATLNDQHYKVNSTPTTTTFSLKDINTGTPVNTTGFGVETPSVGMVIKASMCPKTIVFIDTTRAVYANWTANPSGLAFSRSPDSSTGATRFDDFTTGALDTDALSFTLGPIFDKMDSIQWLCNTNKTVIIGAISSVRRIHGDTIDDPISPSHVNCKPINNVGASSLQPFSNGQTLFYTDTTARHVFSFLFAIQSDDFVTGDQNIAASHLSLSRFKAIAQQRGFTNVLWVLREDGVLLGLTFNEVESIFGWHRQYIGGESVVNGANQNRAKVLSITVEPRINEDPVLWMVVERTVGARTYRSIEYLTAPIRFVERDDFFSGYGHAVKTSDLERYASATFEQLKDSIHLDSAVTYDGSKLSTTITMTPTGTTGSIFINSSASFFDASMVGKEIWKKYDEQGGGGGRAVITGVNTATQASVDVLSDFDNVNAIPAGSWYLTTDKVYGLLHMVGEEVTIQVDGAPGGVATVQADGSVELTAQASKAHIGFPYTGFASTMNLDVAGERGSAQAKIRKILEVLPRFHHTVGARIGTTPWDAEPVTFKNVDDLTDRPTPLFNGAPSVRVADSYERDKKQVVLIQDIPSPQTLLSMDIMVETADE